MVAASVAFVNTSDIPEAAVASQRGAKKTKQVFSKWNLDLGAEEDDSFDAVEVDQPERPTLEALFPSFEPTLVQAIVAETATWEDALDVLLALTDDSVQREQQQRSIAKDAVIDSVGFPPLLDADGWEVVREAALDMEDDGRMWCEVAKEASKVQTMCAARKWETPARPSVLLHGTDQPDNVGWLSADDICHVLGDDMLDGGDQVEFETEHDCRQRRGVERRCNQSKYSHRPAGTKQTSLTKPQGTQTKSKETEPPAWRLCRFEDRL